MEPNLDNIDCLFLDLDGTLLGISDENFSGMYTQLVYRYFKDDIGQDQFVKALWDGTEAMINHSDNNNPVLEEFFRSFTQSTGIGREKTSKRFNEFYQNEFDKLEEACDPIPEAKELINTANDENITLILATNPVFPEIATRKRLTWTNLHYDDFVHVSHAENSNYCKPNPKYFENLLRISNAKPSETLMVGNDYLYDMAASSLGIKTWLNDRYHGNEKYKGKFDINFKGSLSDLIIAIK